MPSLRHLALREHVAYGLGDFCLVQTDGTGIGAGKADGVGPAAHFKKPVLLDGNEVAFGDLGTGGDFLAAQPGCLTRVAQARADGNLQEFSALCVLFGHSAPILAWNISIQPGSRKQRCQGCKVNHLTCGLLPHLQRNVAPHRQMPRTGAHRSPPGTAPIRRQFRACMPNRARWRACSAAGMPATRTLLA